MNTQILISCMCLVTLVCGQDQYQASCTIAEDSGEPSQKIKGDVTFTQAKNNGDVTIKVMLSGFDNTDGKDIHGFHVHASGKLGNKCKDAGGHYNPEGVTHGAPSDSTRHVGDLGNVNETSDGKVDYTFTDSVISISPSGGNKNIIGKSIVVHETFDDLGLGGFPDSNTTGHAGSRLGCCVITASSATLCHISITSLLLSIIISSSNGIL